MKRIMLVEDDPSIAEVIMDYLVFEGYTAKHFEAGDEAFKALASFEPHLVILDVMLPGMNGFDFLKALRRTSTVPVVMVSAKSDDYNAMKGYENGADDYVGKPFRPKILMAKVNALIQRCFPDQVMSTQLKVSQLTFNDGQVKALYEDQDLQLTPKEYELLKMLALNVDHIFTYDSLIRQIDGKEHMLTQNAISAHVKNIRKKINKCGGNGDCIRTIWGVGYRFELDPPAETSESMES